MNPQDVVSLQECVVEDAKNAREKGGQNKSPCCVSWADETWDISREKTRQGSTLHHAKTLLEGIQKQNHVAKQHGQKIQKIYEKQHHEDKRYAHVAKRYATSKDESNQVRTR
jgi:hypothetical protein